MFGMIYANGFCPFQTKDPMDFFHNREIRDTTSVVYNACWHMLVRSECKDSYFVFDKSSPHFFEILREFNMSVGAKNSAKADDVPVVYISLDRKLSANSKLGTGNYLLITADNIFTKNQVYPIMRVADFKISDYDLYFNQSKVAKISTNYSRDQREVMVQDILNVIVFVQLLHNVGMDKKNIPVLSGWRLLEGKNSSSAWLFKDSSALMRPLDLQMEDDQEDDREDDEEEKDADDSFETDFKAYFENHPDKNYKKIEDVVEYAMFSYFPELASRMDEMRKDAKRYGIKTDYDLFAGMFGRDSLPRDVKILHMLPMDLPKHIEEEQVFALLLCPNTIYVISVDPRFDGAHTSKLSWRDFADADLEIREDDQPVECILSWDNSSLEMSTSQEQSMIFQCIYVLHQAMKIHFEHIADNDYIIPKQREAVQNASGNKSNSGCFITSATFAALRGTDDGYELTMFRKFRDGFLASEPDGQELIESYYSIAPRVVNAIDARSNAELIYNDIYNSYLGKCLQYIESGRLMECKQLYIEMVNSLSKKYLS